MSTKNRSYPPQELSSTVFKLPDWIQLGLGDTEYICHEKGATFSAENPPDKLPDITKHANFMTEVLKSNPELYEELRRKKTALGVSLAHCIKTGIDNPAHPFIKTCGITAGDEESYQLFGELFDPIIQKRHGISIPYPLHQREIDITQLSVKTLDTTGKYVLTSRVRTCRSIRGYRLPPTITFKERRSLEQVIVRALLNLTGNLTGDYFPIHGSRSYESKPGGMTIEKELELRSCGNLFQEPDSTLMLSSGCGRHWPDARGIFQSKDEHVYVWVNEEDHIRIISMEKGQNMQGVYTRFVELNKAMEMEIKKAGKEFMHSDSLGFIVTCPSNIGTGLRVGCHIKIPYLSSHPNFKTIVKDMGLQARGSSGVDSAAHDGIVDISNAARVSKTEIELVNTVINGISEIIKLEQMLEKGENITCK